MFDALKTSFTIVIMQIERPLWKLLKLFALKFFIWPPLPRVSIICRARSGSRCCDASPRRPCPRIE
eukprot:1491149-Pyramimonas_sp.AAC.1